MDELKSPALCDLLQPILAEYKLECGPRIHFCSCWQGEDRWICDIYNDYVNIRGRGKILAADPEFLAKFRSAIYQALY